MSGGAYTIVVPKGKRQGWEFAHLLIAHSLFSLKSNEGLWAIRSDRSTEMSDCERIVHLLISLKSNEWLWAIRSDRSWEMCDCERMFRLLKTNEQPWANRSGRSWQMSDRERFAQVAHDKWANERFAKQIWLKSYFLIRFLYVKKTRVIRSFPLFYWAMWANRSGRSPKMSEQSRLLRSLTKNEQMSESLNFLSESLIRSFFHKKRAICSENRWANSQPWFLEIWWSIYWRYSS